MRESLEGIGAKAKDPVQLQKRLGLFSGVALIVGTMIGKDKTFKTLSIQFTKQLEFVIDN